MTSSPRFNLEKSPGQDLCPKCGKPLSLRPIQHYPVVSQMLFGISFIAFLLSYDKLRSFPYAVWGWSLLQLILAAFLIRGRMLARRRVYRCVRCDATLR